MFSYQPLPDLWLLSDQRNDAVLEAAIAKLPRGSGFVYRHYHLSEAERWTRFQDLRRACHACGHLIVLADSAQTAREWGAQGIYGAPRTLYPTRYDMVAIATAHNAREIAEAQMKHADAIMLSPVFPTNSHRGNTSLGPARFNLLAKLTTAPVIALGGMNADNARRLGIKRWAAIDGLS